MLLKNINNYVMVHPIVLSYHLEFRIEDNFNLLFILNYIFYNYLLKFLFKLCLITNLNNYNFGPKFIYLFLNWKKFHP